MVLAGFELPGCICSVVSVVTKVTGCGAQTSSLHSVSEGLSTVAPYGTLSVRSAMVMSPIVTTLLSAKSSSYCPDEESQSPTRSWTPRMIACHSGRFSMLETRNVHSLHSAIWLLMWQYVVRCHAVVRGNTCKFQASPSDSETSAPKLKEKH